LLRPYCVMFVCASRVLASNVSADSHIHRTLAHDHYQARSSIWYLCVLSSRIVAPVCWFYKSLALCTVRVCCVTSALQMRALPHERCFQWCFSIVDFALVCQMRDRKLEVMGGSSRSQFSRALFRSLPVVSTRHSCNAMPCSAGLNCDVQL
jgi:hypothetical protein